MSQFTRLLKPKSFVSAACCGVVQVSGEGVYHVWGFPGQGCLRQQEFSWDMASSISAAKLGCSFWKQPYWKILISQINAWEIWFCSMWECEQVWSAVMSLICPHRFLEPITPGVVQRKGKPEFPAVPVTWGGTTTGWESSTIIPFKYRIALLLPSKTVQFLLLNCSGCCEKLFACLLTQELGRNLWEDPLHLPTQKPSFSLPVTLKTACSSGQSSSPHFCKRQEHKRHMCLVSENSPAAWLIPQWSCFVPFADDLLSEMSETVLLSYWLLLPLYLWCFSLND